MTAVDAVAILLADEAADIAILSPPAAALFEPEGQVAADGNVTWTLTKLSRTGATMSLQSCSRIAKLTCHLLSFCYCVSEQSSLVAEKGGPGPLC